MNRERDLAQSYMKHRPNAAARVLERLSPQACRPVFASVASPVAAQVLVEMLPTHAARCLAEMPPGEAAGLLDKMSSGNAAVMLRPIGEERRDAVLDHLPSLRRRTIETLLTYPRAMIGAWLEPAVFVLRSPVTYGEARKGLKTTPDRIGQRIFIIDERRRLVGEVELGELVRQENRGELTGLEPPSALRTRTSLDAARQHADWRRALEMPVINRRNEFAGIVTREVLMEAVQGLAVQASRDREARHGLATLVWNGMAGVWSVCGEVLAIADVRRR
ncbi:MAG: hypothetical protein R3200_07380 [Xanthomonadales bacterium]|nr:hypothetical protein [Xanthomonadales bacterium]